MTDQMLPLWELALDGVQFFLSLMIFLFLLQNRIKYKHWILKPVPREKSVLFSDEIRLQNIKQLAEKSFDKVVDAINQERLALQTQFELGFADSGQHASALQTSDDFKNVIQDDEKGTGDAALGNFSEIIALADKGLSIREISKRLNMPGGEIELILRLNKNDDSGGFTIPAEPASNSRSIGNGLPK